MLPDHPELMPIKETKPKEEMVVWEEEWVVEIDFKVVTEEKEDINKEKEENLLMLKIKFLLVIYLSKLMNMMLKITLIIVDKL